MRKEIENRINLAKKDIKNYPEWVTESSYFQGGKASEYRSNLHENKNCNITVKSKK